MSDRDDYDQRPVSALIADPLLRDHAWLRTQLAKTVVLARQLQAEHGDHPKLPPGLVEHLTGIQKAWELHFEREEKIVFPLVLSGRSAQAQESIRGLEAEHHDLREAMMTTRRLTANLTAPIGASPVWRELYAALVELETRAETHTKFEYDVFFPRVFYDGDNSASIPEPEEN